MTKTEWLRPLALLLCASATPLAAATRGALWSSSPATYGSSGDDDYILNTGYLLGNGKLGAIPFGVPGSEKLNLNLDSLWSGGPFENTVCVSFFGLCVVGCIGRAIYRQRN